MRTDTEIKDAGFSALNTKLDNLEVERFIALVNRQKFDYTEWRKTLFEDMTIDEISARANEYTRKQFSEE
ncbi:hypothetical protein [Turneriella parva]|uniref:Uncharacterized protein n=1 Tax=Turneriella parva (strain ATCC BAA-1111 / DSM 21527 / NCTC 11395 / H) TaxID=869212 RepID=I4B2J9_TURPD|nr:hypothetical protein [Turneriella parva]AFM11506.1 hypothetical protein Turpa_0855 [Turneriella parva DSM 21527]